jgi:type I restriction enzyme R subunit
MTERFGLSESTILKIQSALAQFPIIECAILYGSRAKGNYRSGSDIDLTLKLNSTAPRDFLTKIMLALDDLELIYLFDVSVFEALDNADLIEHIKRVGVEFYRAP